MPGPATKPLATAVAATGRRPDARSPVPGVEVPELPAEREWHKGPHPQAESDFELFCEIVPEALGL
jgi:hypothetical protein